MADKSQPVVEEDYTTTAQQSESSEQRSSERSNSNSARDRIADEVRDSRSTSTNDTSLWQNSTRTALLERNWNTAVSSDSNGLYMATNRDGQLTPGSPNYLYRDPMLNLSQDRTSAPPGGVDAAGTLGDSGRGRAPGAASMRAESVALIQGGEQSLRRVQGDRRADAGDQPQSASIEQARENLRQSLEAMGTSPAKIQEIMTNMAKMEARLRDNPAQTRDGKLDPTKESIKAYDALAGIANGDSIRAENGIRFSSDRNVNNQRVEAIVTDASRRVAKLETAHNQGPNNTCALEADGRQHAALAPGDYCATLNRATNTGRIVDGRGRETILDKQSLCNFDAQANANTDGHGRGAAGKIMDLARGQWVENNINNSFGENQRTTYRQGAPSGRGDTGERVFENATGKVLATNPRVDAKQLSDMKQELFGYKFADDFGKQNTITNSAAFRGANFSSFSDPKEYAAHIAAMEAKGWKYATAAMHTANWNTDGSNGGDGGWHAISVSIARDANGNPRIGSDGLAMIHQTNQWDGKYQQDRTATQALADGKSPIPGQNWNPNGNGGSDHTFDGGKHRDLNPNADKGNNERNQEEKEKEKSQKQKEQEDQVRKAQKAQLNAAGLAAISAQIASLQSELGRIKDSQSGRRDEINNEINSLRKRTDTTLDA